MNNKTSIQVSQLTASNDNKATKIVANVVGMAEFALKQKAGK